MMAGASGLDNGCLFEIRLVFGSDSDADDVEETLTGLPARLSSFPVAGSLVGFLFLTCTAGRL
jgi:hypothetical protein